MVIKIKLRDCEELSKLIEVIDDGIVHQSEEMGYSKRDLKPAEKLSRKLMTIARKRCRDYYG